MSCFGNPARKILASICQGEQYEILGQLLERPNTKVRHFLRPFCVRIGGVCQWAPVY